MDPEKYRQRLLVLERELVRKLEREVEAARTTAGEQPEPGDQSVVDGEPIEAERLEAVPWTAFCARHQQEMERPVRTPGL